MVKPLLLCRQHLLGEHYEIHMLAGALVRNKTITGYVVKGLLEPSALHTRHEELVREMGRRGMNHKSPLPSVNVNDWEYGFVNPEKSVEELQNRCSRCATRIQRGEIK